MNVQLSEDVATHTRRVDRGGIWHATQERGHCGHQQGIIRGASRKNYDRIVIQFGAEGHAGLGFFCLDDFEFVE